MRYHEVTVAYRALYEECIALVPKRRLGEEEHVYTPAARARIVEMGQMADQYRVDLCYFTNQLDDLLYSPEDIHLGRKARTIPYEDWVQGVRLARRREVGPFALRQAPRYEDEDDDLSVADGHRTRKEPDPQPRPWLEKRDCKCGRRVRVCDQASHVCKEDEMPATKTFQELHCPCGKVARGNPVIARHRRECKQAAKGTLKSVPVGEKNKPPKDGMDLLKKVAEVAVSSTTTTDANTPSALVPLGEAPEKVMKPRAPKAKDPLRVLTLCVEEISCLPEADQLATAAYIWSKFRKV